MTRSTPSLTLPSDARILVIRRDNIGDLVCTTPMLQALRERFPQARIDALVNTYNADVLSHNPYLNKVYAYTKAKHRGSRSLAEVYASRIRLTVQLRRARYDCAILASAGYACHAARFARWIKPRHVIGFIDGKNRAGIDLPIPTAAPRPLHEAEDVFRLLLPLGIEGTPPRACVRPDAAEVECMLAQLPSAQKPTLVGVHVSARLPSNRWPSSHFIMLLRALHARYGLGFMLFWSPGDAANKYHPGDDEKAREILAGLSDVSIFPCPTSRLSQLIAGLSLCDSVICSDGGAMHVAAGLGKPIVCFFGETEAPRWYPWGVDYQLVQPLTKCVADISVDEAVAAYARLRARTYPSADVMDHGAHAPSRI